MLVGEHRRDSYRSSALSGAGCCLPQTLRTVMMLHEFLLPRAGRIERQLRDRKCPLTGLQVTVAIFRALKQGRSSMRLR